MNSFIPNKRINTLLLFVLILLFIGYLISKQSAEYLVRVSHKNEADSPSIKPQPSLRYPNNNNHGNNIVPVIYPTPFEYHIPTEDEHFITYLPHSGFHNQRIELENAFLLAHYLNRTLLLPPVFLGNPAFPWQRYDKMYERLLLQTKRGLEYCSQLREGEPLPSECLNYSRWTSVPWTFFYDLGEMSQYVRIVFKDDLSIAWMHDYLNINTTTDIYYFKDTSPFDYRIYDLPDSKTPLARFVNRIDISTLEAIEERVIQFGSLFGTYRVLAQTREHVDFLLFIRENMIFKNPTLMEVATRVVDRLGGVGQFIGVHLRVGDGLFKVKASINVDDIYHQLVDEYTDLTLEEVTQYDPHHDEDRKEDDAYEIRQLRGTQPMGNQDKPIQVNHPAEDILKTRLGPTQNNLKCGPMDGRNNRFAMTTVYIATDCPQPRTHPLLRKIFRTFPCVFVLSDFKDELAELSRIEVRDEQVKLESYLIPMIDAIISAHGHTFYGTNSSTFSAYIERQLHPIYTHQPMQLVGAPLP
ncbi:GDP-fucose protein O-fucosyltransferase-domain-containing protein [Pilobolus umbonatus]|nr:GDP-fucose protein O-fucosyltransferase-domain-containing protein [Pilobolus umbonatus]